MDNLAPSDIGEGEVAASTITPPSDCMMCSEIIKLFHAPYHENDNDDFNDIRAILGQVSDRLADNCPHATWLRYIKYSGGQVPFYEKRKLYLYRFRGAGNLVIHYHKRHTRASAMTSMFQLVFRSEIPGHVGTLRVLDERWIDLNIIKDWRSTCMRVHGESCNKTVGAVPPFKPRLLIDVVQGCVTVSKEEEPRFLTLSYTWGRSKNLRITKANANEMKQPGVLRSKGILSRLPRTILDAIELTKALEERWLWVDSLCIIQDDEEGLQRELAAMHQIYATSFLTIVAADGQDAEYGLRGLSGISEPRETKQNLLSLSNGERIVCIQRPYNKDGDESELGWDQRMWTSQEYDFSKRCLIFEKGRVTWNCNKTWSEDHLYRPEKETPIERVFGGYVGRGSHLKVPSLFRLSQLIQYFNERALSYEEDVFNAFAGYNTYLNSIFPSGLVYGHPQILFDIALCWLPLKNIRRRKVSERYNEDPADVRLPSWSWMGWKGQIVFPSDSESEVGGTPNVGFTESITEWYAIEYPGSSQKQRINSVWSHCRKVPPGSMAETWRCEEFKPPALTRWSTGTRNSSDAITVPKNLPSHRYISLSDARPCPELRWYPIPVMPANAGGEAPSGLHSGYRYLWCRTGSAILTATNEKLYPSERFYRLPWQLPYHLLKNEDGGNVGALLPHNEHDSESLRQDTPVELIAIAKGWSTILKEESVEKEEITTHPAETPLTLEEEEAIKEEKKAYWSEFYKKVPWMDRFNEGKEKKQDGYHVLWIEWESGVAYRKGYGFVLDEEWDRVAGTSRVDITLG